VALQFAEQQDIAKLQVVGNSQARSDTQAGQELEKSSTEQSGELNLVLQQWSKLILKTVSMQNVQNTQFLEEHTYTWKTKLMMHLLM
jgi:hypothetical protein